MLHFGLPVSFSVFFFSPKQLEELLVERSIVTGLLGSRFEEEGSRRRSGEEASSLFGPTASLSNSMPCGTCLVADHVSVCLCTVNISVQKFRFLRPFLYFVSSSLLRLISRKPRTYIPVGSS